MKKILLILFLFLAFCMPSFSASSTFVSDITQNTLFIPDITITDAKNGLLTHFVSDKWQVKSSSDNTIDLYILMQPDGSMDRYMRAKYLYLSKGWQYYENDIIRYPLDTKIEKEGRLHFTLLEKDNGVILTFTLTEIEHPNTGYEKATYINNYGLKHILDKLFIGKYSYNLKYSIKKDYVKISDTTQTKLGNNRKIVKINDKNISEYTKANLKNLLENCTQEQIKLETNDTMGKQTFYINRTYTEPIYKQYL